ncbi:MAG: DUF899 domain-containing protein [candidate division Zixibacteria bacterium]|nr:DUF899 domain-containing protein [candidate division Zixibacteria bacterium]
MNELIVVHNIGRSCPYCTMWADGFNGIVNHLENRAGFVVISPSPPEIQKEFAASHNWKFQLLPGHGTSFIEDIGFKTGEGGYMPGVSAFVRDKGGNLFRVNKNPFGPGDNYSGTWHLLDLLPEGSNDWQPKFSY